MRLKVMMVGIIIMASIMVAGGVLYTDAGTHYMLNATYSSSQFEEFNATMEDVRSNAQSMQEHTTGVLQNSDLVTQLTDATLAFVNAGAIVLKIPSIFGGMMQAMFGLFGSATGLVIPSWFGTMVTIIIAVTITFMVVNIFVKSEEI